MIAIKILLVFFFLLAIFKVVARYQAGDLRRPVAVGWIMFWCVATFVVVLPNSSAYFAKLFGIGRGADLVIYLSLALLFYFSFRTTVRSERQSKEITILTRKIALLEARDKDK